VSAARPHRIVVGVSGATGSPLALRVLEMLGDAGVERHLVVSPSARRTAAHEIPGVRFADHAEVHHSWRDIGASIASGSFPFDAMLVVPCSVKTLSGIAMGLSDNLLTRAADVALKERRRLVLAVRETPLHLGHLRAMATVTEIGAIVAPPMPAYYVRPQTVEDITDHACARLLSLVGIEVPGAAVWTGEPRAACDVVTSLSG
jgi:polyprenyl P-hydroxybenzoate/phenylacrylic acid decarboxylase-like protein